MKVTVFGSGYVGLVAANCLAEVGNEVVCMDINTSKIEKLNQGICPLYEPGLESLLKWNLKQNRIRFTTDSSMAAKHGLCQFIAVGTPPDPQGKANLEYVYQVAKVIAENMEDYTIIIDKSTVPIGTADKVESIIQQELKARGKKIPFDVASNPEFLKEGAALEDFQKPDRIVIGVESEKAKNIISDLYAPFNVNDARLLTMDKRSAELTKYAANALLATKISFMNEMANLAEKVGADIDKVRIAIGADQRIGHHFIYPGCGYGGSCFGKDVQALVHTAQQVDSGNDIIKAVEKVNQKQKQRLFGKIDYFYRGDLKDKTFAVWGLAFKPETDDMRDAPSIDLIQALLSKGAKIRAYDPEAMIEAKKIFGLNEQIQYTNSPESALEGSNALVILTQWRVFRSPDFEQIKTHIQDRVIFDGRNIYDPEFIESLGIKYIGMGRGDVSATFNEQQADSAA